MEQTQEIKIDLNKEKAAFYDRDRMNESAFGRLCWALEQQADQITALQAENAKLKSANNAA